MASKSGVTLMNSTESRVRLARTFLRSLSKIKSQRPTATAATTTVSPSSLRRRIKIAAYSSMARAAGPRPAWARALLFKLQTRARHRTLMRCHRRRRHRHHRSSDDQVGRLRRVLPGGGAMDVCTLLEETAHYIHCLSTQVKVMKAISHFLSSD